MSLIKCPECKKKISDNVDKCPNCGNPITDEIKITSIQLMEQQQEQNRKLMKKICIIAIIVVCLCIVLSAVYYILNLEKISISKAQEYMANQQYEKVIKILDKYKDSNDTAKELYDDATFMTSDEGEFLIDFADGLKERWDIADADDNNDAEHLKNLIHLEYDRLSKYEKTTFDDDVFNEKAHLYINALKKSLSALDYLISDYTKYTKLWSEAYKERSVLITYFLNNYPVPIDDKYSDVKAEFQTNANGIEAEQKFESAIDMMIHKDNFVLTKNSGDWRTYQITITNDTDITFKYFGLKVNCLNTDNEILEQVTTNQISNFAPEQTATFEFMTDKNPESMTWTADYYIQ